MTAPEVVLPKRKKTRRGKRGGKNRRRPAVPEAMTHATNPAWEATQPVAPRVSADTLRALRARLGKLSQARAHA